MAKYRKKPVVIEAWHWTFDGTDRGDCPSWMNDSINKWPEMNGANFEPDHTDGPRIAIATLEGVHIANPGDWIIQGVKGELYPCKPDIFEMTYEPVVEEESAEEVSES